MSWRVREEKVWWSLASVLTRDLLACLVSGEYLALSPDFALIALPSPLALRAMFARATPAWFSSVKISSNVLGGLDDGNALGPHEHQVVQSGKAAGLGRFVEDHVGLLTAVWGQVAGIRPGQPKANQSLENQPGRGVDGVSYIQSAGNEEDSAGG